MNGSVEMVAPRCGRRGYKEGVCSAPALTQPRRKRAQSASLVGSSMSFHAASGSDERKWRSPLAATPPSTDCTRTSCAVRCYTRRLSVLISHQMVRVCVARVSRSRGICRRSSALQTARCTGKEYIPGCQRLRCRLNGSRERKATTKPCLTVSSNILENYACW
jgi:hypothetical protein